MPVTTLDPTTALILVDLQAGSSWAPTAHPFETVVANAATLADTFRALQMPVVLVNATGVAPGRTEHPIDVDAFPEGWSDLLPELGGRPSDILITKHTWDAFAGTGLAEHLRQVGVTQVVLAGHATSFGVESTARHAHALGLHVTLATDAMTDPSSAAHHHAVEVIFPMLGETGTTEELLVLLHQRQEPDRAGNPAAGSAGPAPLVGR